MSGDVITCKSCGRSFLWSYGEQDFFREHALQPPKHCKECIAQRKRVLDPGMRSEVGPLFEFRQPDSQRPAPRDVTPPPIRRPQTTPTRPEPFQLPHPRAWWQRPGNLSTMIFFWLLLALIVFKLVGGIAAVAVLALGGAVAGWLFRQL